MAHNQLNVGVYGGTFDPIHFGHLNLAIEIMEKQALNEVWFCPARLNPHKQGKDASASIEQRMRMIELAIIDIPQFRLLDVEANRPGPSYTVDTLHELLFRERLSTHPNKLHLMLGNDSLKNFLHWHCVEEIVNLVPLLVGMRNENTMHFLEGNAAVRQAVEKGLIKTKIMEISSTEIRQRIQKQLYCGHLLPTKVMDYIYKLGLYS